MASSLISSITGTLDGIGPDWADVSVGGVTLRVSVPGSTVERLGKLGDRTTLLTSLQVREDSLTLFGFLTKEARAAFETLIGITGVGPRLALSVLSRFTPDSLAVAVASGDTAAFSSVPGVASKTAGRIVLELKGKLGTDLSILVGPLADADVVDALTALGYTLSEANEAASSLPAGDSSPLEDKVRRVLERMGGG